MTADNAATDDDALDRLIEGMFPTGEGFAAPVKWAEQVKGQLLASDWLAERDARVRADALREAARDFPTRSHAHHACFREDAHLVPRGCFYGPDWLRERADCEYRIPPGQEEGR